MAGSQRQGISLILFRLNPFSASGNLMLLEVRKQMTKFYTFEPAYGAQDKYYGWMNITTWTNLDDREIVLELFPVKNMWVEIKYNRFYIPVADDVNTFEYHEFRNQGSII